MWQEQALIKQPKACVTLHGDAPMTKKVGEKAPEDNDYDVYEAHVDITPIISRVEIKSY